MKSRNIFPFYKNLIFGNRKWLYLTLAIFGIGVLVGLSVSVLQPSASETIIKSYAASIDQNIEPGLDLSLYIFKRNFQIVALTSLLSFAFSLPAAFIAFINGVIIGVVVGFAEIYQSVNPWQLFLLLFPHGIFEYAGIFLGLSFGLRWGLNWLRADKGKRRSTFMLDFKKLVAIFPLVFILLAVAALVEGFLTLQIACWLGNLCR